MPIKTKNISYSKKEHMKNMTKFIGLMIVFYIFVYYMIILTIVITSRSLDLDVFHEFIAHVIASLMILLTIFTYEPGKNKNYKINS